MKLAPRDPLDVDRRIPVTEIRHQLLFKTQNNFFRENLTMDNSLENRKLVPGIKRSPAHIPYRLFAQIISDHTYKALLYS